MTRRGRLPGYLGAMLAALCLSVVGVSAQSGEPSQPVAESSAPSVPSATGKTFTYIPHLTGHPVWLVAKEGWDTIGSELGFTGQWTGSATTGDPAELVAALDAAIVQGVDGIAIAAISPSAMNASIDRAVEAGIPVVTILADAVDSQRQAFLGSDVVRFGQLGAQAIQEATGGEGKVAVILGDLSIENQRMILENFTAELAKTPGLQIVATEADNNQMETSVEKVEALLTAHPDLRAIFGINANVPIAACQVFKERGITKEQVAMVGPDDLPETLACIRDGTITASIAQNFYGAGYLAGELLARLSGGESVPEINDSGIALVTPETIDTYAADFRDL